MNTPKIAIFAAGRFQNPPPITIPALTTPRRYEIAPRPYGARRASCKMPDTGQSRFRHDMRGLSHFCHRGKRLGAYPRSSISTRRKMPDTSQAGFRHDIEALPLPAIPEKYCTHFCHRGKRPGAYPRSSIKSRQSGLPRSISSIFHLRCHFLSRFSAAIASFTSAMPLHREAAGHNTESG